MSPTTLDQVREQLALLNPVFNEMYIDVSFVDAGTLTIPAGKFVRVHGNGSLTAEGPGSVTVGGNAFLRASGGGLRVYGYDNAHVVAENDCFVHASASAKVRAMRGAQVVADGNAHVDAARGAVVAASGHATVNAWAMSRVSAYENAYVMSQGAHVTAAASATVHGWVHNTGADTPTLVPAFDRNQGWSNTEQAARAWCARWALPVDEAGITHVYKGVGADYRAASKLPSGKLPVYAPGSTPEAPDWDQLDVDCGAGLHFSPHPAATFEYRGDAAKFLKCPVSVREMVVLGDKVKVKRVLPPGCVEVNILGEPV